MRCWFCLLKGRHYIWFMILINFKIKIEHTSHINNGKMRKNLSVNNATENSCEGHFDNCNLLTYRWVFITGTMPKLKGRGIRFQCWKTHIGRRRRPFGSIVRIRFLWQRNQAQRAVVIEWDSWWFVWIWRAGCSCRVLQCETYERWGRPATWRDHSR